MSDEHNRSTSAHSTGSEDNHLWCQRTALVVVMPWGSWERGAGCDDWVG